MFNEGVVIKSFEVCGEKNVICFSTHQVTLVQLAELEGVSIEFRICTNLKRPRLIVYFTNCSRLNKGVVVSENECNLVLYFTKY